MATATRNVCVCTCVSIHIDAQSYYFTLWCESRIVYVYIYPYGRGLTALLILYCWGNAKACRLWDKQEQHPMPFFLWIHKSAKFGEAIGTKTIFKNEKDFFTCSANEPDWL